MWITALIGAVTAVVESTLGQAYKEKNMGEFIGGPQYYIAKGLHCKPLAIAFACAAILGPGLLMPAMQTHSTAVAVQDAFGAPLIATGIVICVVLGLVIFGGIQRIGKIAEILAPVMCGLYLICGLIIMFTHLASVPHAFALMFKAAFARNNVRWYRRSDDSMGRQEAFTRMKQDRARPYRIVEREMLAPCKGRALSRDCRYIDTLLICSITGISIMAPDFTNVSSNAAGTKPGNERHTGVEYGVSWMNRVMEASMAAAGRNAPRIHDRYIRIHYTHVLLSGRIRTQISDGRKQSGRYIFRAVYLVANFFGIIANGQVIWSMGDTGAGLMAWFNLIAIILMAPVAIRSSRLRKSETSRA